MFIVLACAAFTQNTFCMHRSNQMIIDIMLFQANKLHKKDKKLPLTISNACQSVNQTVIIHVWIKTHHHEQHYTILFAKQIH